MRNMKFFKLPRYGIVALALLSLISTAIAQPVIEWEKNYGGIDSEWAESVQQTSDGGYVVAGYIWGGDSSRWDVYVLKLDPNGNVEWEKNYGGGGAYSVQQTSDGGYIVAGSSGDAGDVYVLKLDPNGNVEWEKNYGGSHTEVAESVQQTSDGGYVVAGYTMTDSGYYDVLVLKLDSNGNVEWSKTYGGSYVDGAHSVQQTSDGGYIIAGDTASFGNGEQVYILKLDRNGNVAWEKTYGESSSGESGQSIQQTSDGGYIVAGGVEYDSGYTDVWILKLDSNGNIQWQKAYGGAGDDWAMAIQQTSDGGYIAAGYTMTDSGGRDVYVLKLDPNGNVEWSKTYGGSNYDMGYSVHQTLDDGYIVAGETRSFSNGLSDVWILKLSSDTAPQNQPPVASFAFYPTNPYLGEYVAFNASSSYDPDGWIVSYSWDFNGDGVVDKTGTQPYYNYTYSSAGTYTVTLTVTDNDGLTASTSKQITVSPPNNPPSVSLLSPQNGNTFDSSTTSVALQWSGSDPDGDSLTYDLYFGTSSSPSLYDSSLASTSYTISVSAGKTYYWKIVADDGNGGTASSAVWSFSVEAVTPTPEPPVAYFTFSPTSPETGETVTFDASSSYDPDGLIVSYVWNFGDGSYKSTSTPTIQHTYSSAGTYTVTLTVTDNDGLTASTSKQITVEIQKYSLNLRVHNIPNKPLPSVGGTITVEVYSGNEKISSKEISYHGGEDYKEVFFFSLPSGDYTVKVYQEPQEGALRYEEYWGEMQVSLNQDKTVDFYRNTLVIQDVRINGESLYNSPSIPAGPIDMEVVVKNYGQVSRTARVELCMLNSKTNDICFYHYQQLWDQELVTINGGETKTIRISSELFAGLIGEDIYLTIVISDKNYGVMDQNDWLQIRVYADKLLDFDPKSDGFRFQNEGFENSPIGMCYGMSAVASHFYGWKNNGYEFTEDGKTYYAKLPLDFNELYDAVPPSIVNGILTYLDDRDGHVLAIYLHQVYQSKTKYPITIQNAKERLNSNQLVALWLDKITGVDHSVVAIGYSERSNGNTIFYIYDPNHPAEIKYIECDSNGNIVAPSDYLKYNKLKPEIIEPLTYDDVKEHWSEVVYAVRSNLLTNFKVAMSYTNLKIESGSNTGYFDDQGIFHSTIYNTAGFLEYYTDRNKVIGGFFAVAYPKNSIVTITPLFLANPSNLKKDPITIVSFGETTSGITVEADKVGINDTGTEYIIEAEGTTNITTFTASDEGVETTAATLPGGIILASENQISVDSDRDGTVDDTLRPPKANFNLSVSGLKVTFDASNSYDPDGEIVGYEWDFGDNRTASGITVSHTYSEPGNYTVTLTVTDNDGLTAKMSKQITVLQTQTEKQQLKQDILSLIVNYLQTQDAQQRQQLKQQILQKIMQYLMMG